MRIEGHEVAVTISIGVAPTPAGDETIATLMKEADEALYRAEREGRNRVATAGNAGAAVSAAA
ncbi:MAG: diguanylate cyclase [Hyphomicrobiales bacterium]|nr:diguanylate cyclase [Hyphomicrobiales bacterium]